MARRPLPVGRECAGSVGSRSRARASRVPGAGARPAEEIERYASRGERAPEMPRAGARAQARRRSHLCGARRKAIRCRCTIGGFVLLEPNEIHRAERDRGGPVDMPRVEVVVGSHDLVHRCGWGRVGLRCFPGFARRGRLSPQMSFEPVGGGSSATRSRAPGSSNRCVAWGMIASHFSERSSASASQFSSRPAGPRPRR